MLKTKLNILIMVACCFSMLAVAHESRDIGGMNMVFGGEPEPMFTGEKQFLRWRLTELKTDEPVSDLEDMQVTVKIDGKEYGPFEARESWQSAGTYQTMLIFTQAGDGTATLNYKGTEKVKSFSESFQFSVRARETISIP
jgi:hypothetical protein